MQHTVVVDLRRYPFEAEATPDRPGYLTISAPGVVEFQVDDADRLGLRRARDILWAVYRERALT